MKIMPLTWALEGSAPRNVPGFREIRSKPLSRQVSDLDVPNSRIPHEGGGEA